jgi:catechol 2,3-dioxygenase-like lactoylglutathione lyase family enzyme
MVDGIVPCRDGAVGRARKNASGQSSPVGIALDHLILPVNDIAASIDFYTSVLGLTAEGQTGPFSVVRVTPDLTLQLAPWGTDGGAHLAFALEQHAFDAAFERIRAAGLDWGDSFHTVGTNGEPGEEDGAHGMGATVYTFDPSKHLIEIRTYAP